MVFGMHCLVVMAMDSYNTIDGTGTSGNNGNNKAMYAPEAYPSTELEQQAIDMFSKCFNDNIFFLLHVYQLNCKSF